MQDEFLKLDNIDRKVLFWMMDNRPQAIHSWLSDMARVYKRKNIVINVAKLYAEVELELTPPNDRKMKN